MKNIINFKSILNLTDENGITDPDILVSNLELESGDDLLLEDGSFILLEG